MGILNVVNSQVGLVGATPNICYIQTDDTPTEITTANYLKAAINEGLVTLTFNNHGNPPVSNTVFFVSSTVGVLILDLAITGTSPNLTYTLGPLTQSGGTIYAGNVQAGLNGTAGRFITYPATLNTGHMEFYATSNAGNFTVLVTNASQAGNRTLTMPDPGVAAASFLLTQSAGTQTIATGNLALSVGTLTLGSAGNASSLTLFPATAANGTLIISPLNAGGAFNTTIRNSVMGQSSVISIPDPGAATANFLLDAGTANLVTDYQQMVPITEFALAAGGGAFTLTRNAQGNWSQLKAAAADISIIAMDVTEQLRAAAGRGFELTSFDVMYSIATDVLTAHTATLSSTVFANNVAVAVTNVAITGALATATQAQPYLTNVTVNVPAFSNPAANTSVKQVIELTVNSTATAVYNFYGVNLRFTKSIK